MKRLVRGQSVVEMALILPFMVLIILGTIELGYYIYIYSELENATRIAAEAAAKTPPLTFTSSDDSLSAATPDYCAIRAKDAALKYLFLSKLRTNELEITYPGIQIRQPGTGQVQVEAETQVEWLTPLGTRFFGNKLTFNFVSRRTITSVKAPDNLNADCTPYP